MKYTFRWLTSGWSKTAHLCVQSDKKQWAAICGFGERPKWRRAGPSANPCSKCLEIDRSGIEIAFIDPKTLRKSIIRPEARR